MFHFDGGLKLTRAGLAVDFCRRQPRAFISHAHADHMARHEYALCTPTTSALYQLRLGRRQTLELPYRAPVEWGGLRLTTYPAGHCAGSAMLLAEDGEQSLLVTGDFKLGPSATAERAELPSADVLVIESTYGDPRYRLPPRDEALGEFFRLVNAALASGATPVVYAYTLGKAQEITRLLTAEGIPVAQHPDIFRVSQVYQQCGVALGDYTLYQDEPAPQAVVIVPPGRRRRGDVTQIARPVTFAVTGWAVDGSARYRLGVDHAIPISDHADYDELFEAVRRVDAKEIHCTHGPESFVDRLREAGFNAFPLGRPHQRRLF